jgi:hypothetical protein
MFFSKERSKEQNVFFFLHTQALRIEGVVVETSKRAHSILFLGAYKIFKEGAVVETSRKLIRLEIHRASAHFNSRKSLERN